MLLLLPALFIVSMAFAQLDLLVTPALPNLALNTNKGVFFFWNTNKGEKEFFMSGSFIQPIVSSAHAELQFINM